MRKRRVWRGVAHVALHVSILFGGLALSFLTPLELKWIWPVAALISFATFIVASRLAAREERRRGTTAANGSADKVYTQWTASEIVEAVKGQTSMQATGIVQPHRGKWLKVDGEVRDISELPTLFWWHYIPLVILGEESGLTFSMRFKRRRWRAELETLRQGDRLAAEGRITDIGPTMINLDNCEVTGIEVRRRTP